jgi:hypothetical protein
MSQKEKILLALPPFWTPLTPPVGLSCLKGFLQRHGWGVKTVDLNVVDHLRDYYNRYVEGLKKSVPQDRRGNYYSIVNDVLRNHAMAHLHRQEEGGYRELVKILIRHTFYFDADESLVSTLVGLMEEFYAQLESYWLELLDREKPGILGLSVYSDNLSASVYAFRLTRAQFPHIRTVMGGGVFADQLAVGSPNLDLFLEKTESDIDKIIVGEGENLLLKWLQGDLPASRRVYTLEDIHGETLELSTVDTLDLSDFQLQSYPYMVSYTSRSCPFQCSFCSETVQWGKYRKKGTGQIVKELQALQQQYRGQLFLLSDSLLNPVISDLAGALAGVEAPIYWEGWLRAEKKVGSIENTQLWRRGGFYHARIGAESGSARVLGLMGKKITPELIKESLFSLAYAGIKTTTLWIVGYPGETEEDFRQTLALIEELKDDIYQAEGTPFWYFPTGQSSSGDWASRYQRRLLYPPWARDLLIAQTWVLECDPPREKVFDRLNSFVRHIGRLGIPNTYSLHDIYRADDRWKKLHKNAVPPLVEFKNKTGYIDECRRAKTVSFARNTLNDDVGFAF